VLYLFYGAFTLTGFVVWMRVQRRRRALVAAELTGSA
jgi:nicotinamide mononucleotide transporter